MFSPLSHTTVCVLYVEGVLRMKHDFTVGMEERRCTVLRERDGMTSAQHQALKLISLFFFVTFHSQREDFIFSNCEVEAQGQSHRRARRLMQPCH